MRRRLEPVPDGVERVSMMPDDAVRTYANHPRSVVVALTHDPKLDDMALLDALNSPAFYVGAIGSQLNSDRRRERLQTLGITDRTTAASACPRRPAARQSRRTRDRVVHHGRGHETAKQCGADRRAGSSRCMKPTSTGTLLAAAQETAGA